MSINCCRAAWRLQVGRQALRVTRQLNGEGPVRGNRRRAPETFSDALCSTAHWAKVRLGRPVIRSTSNESRTVRGDSQGRGCQGPFPGNAEGTLPALRRL